MPPIHTHSCDCTQPTAKVEQRGTQTDCTESTCKPSGNHATALNARLAADRAAAKSTARYSPTQFASRGRSSTV